MKVKALISFVGYDQNRKKIRAEEGQEFDLPAGVDWLKKGLVEEIKAEGGRVKDESSAGKRPHAKAAH